MIRSMTSFGRSSSEEGQKRVFTVEMKSVNSRYLAPLLIAAYLLTFFISMRYETLTPKRVGPK